MNRNIYPPSLADSMKSHAGEKYRPSNGTEGDIFFAGWRQKCARDKAMSEGADIDECDDNERCDIIGKTMAFDTDEEGYPSEWQYGADGQPCCTAFIPAGDPIPEPRCELTKELF